MNIPKKIKVKWHNGMEEEILNQTYDPSRPCEVCDKKGAFFVNEEPIVGLCFTHILEQYDEENVEIVISEKERLKALNDLEEKYQD